jgi:hypothetical protein
MSEVFASPYFPSLICVAGLVVFIIITYLIAAKSLVLGIQGLILLVRRAISYVARWWSYDEQVLSEAFERYDAAWREEEARYQSLSREPVPIIPLNETESGHMGVGADGELIEIDPSEPPENLTDVSP